MATEDLLRRELEDAYRGRAHLYRAIYDELAAEYGAAAAERVLARAIEKRGREVAAALFPGLGPQDARAIGEKFVSVSPDEGRMYPNEVTTRPDGLSIKVHRCPLKDAWRDSGLDDSQVATLCRIAGAFDKGLFEAPGIAFANETWSAVRGDTGCCRIHLRDAA